MNTYAYIRSLVQFAAKKNNRELANDPQSRYTEPIVAEIQNNYDALVLEYGEIEKAIEAIVSEVFAAISK